MSSYHVRSAMHLSDDGKRREWNTPVDTAEFLAASGRANTLREQLCRTEGAGVFFDPRCLDSDFFRITVLRGPE